MPQEYCALDLPPMRWLELALLEDAYPIMDRMDAWSSRHCSNKQSVCGKNSKYCHGARALKGTEVEWGLVWDGK